jgi:plastocyanin
VQSKSNTQNWLGLALALLLSVALAACSSSATAAPGPTAQTLSVNALDTFKYDPPSLTVKVGQPVHIVLANKGALVHTFVIDEFGVKISNVQGGATGDATFTPAQAGIYVYYCDTPGHKDAGMKGTLTVTP